MRKQLGLAHPAGVSHVVSPRDESRVSGSTADHRARGEDRGFALEIGRMLTRIFGQCQTMILQKRRFS
jgi:hypothetical protein